MSPSSRYQNPALVVIRNSIMASFALLFMTVALVSYADVPAVRFFSSMEYTVWHEGLRLLALYINPYTIFAGTAGLLGMHAYSLQQQGERIETDRTVILLGGVLVSLILTLLLKVSIGRARPVVLFTEGYTGFFGFQTERSFNSFPSGHATAVTAACAAVFALREEVSYRVIAVMLTVLILSSRLVLGEHFPADVLAGIWLGGLVMYWAQLFANLAEERL
ncbi:MAG: phosphatase PAP2 family protein [Balneolales bacterium]|nr:phosphatase PAP2 family protein [Balneolales bacterium]